MAGRQKTVPGGLQTGGGMCAAGCRAGNRRSGQQMSRRIAGDRLQIGEMCEREEKENGRKVSV